MTSTPTMRQHGLPPADPRQAAAPRGGAGDSRAARATPRDPARLRLDYQQANPVPPIRDAIPLPGIVNDLSDPDPRNWRTKLPTYAGLVYGGLYDDLIVGRVA